MTPRTSQTRRRLPSPADALLKAARSLDRFALQHVGVDHDPTSATDAVPDAESESSAIIDQNGQTIADTLRRTANIECHRHEKGAFVFDMRDDHGDTRTISITTYSIAIAQSGSILTLDARGEDLPTYHTYLAAQAILRTDGSHATLAIQLCTLVTETISSLLNRLRDQKARARTSQRIARTRHALALCSTMAETVRPGHLAYVVADDKRRRVDLEIRTNADKPIPQNRIVHAIYPLPEHLVRMIHGRSCIVASSYVGKEIDEHDVETGRCIIGVEFRPGRQVMSAPSGQSPITTAKHLREHGGDGSEVAATIDAALLGRAYGA